MRFQLTNYLPWVRGYRFIHSHVLKSNHLWGWVGCVCVRCLKFQARSTVTVLSPYQMNTCTDRSHLCEHISIRSASSHIHFNQEAKLKRPMPGFERSVICLAGSVVQCSLCSFPVSGQCTINTTLNQCVL